MMTVQPRLFIKHLYVSPAHNYFGHHGREASANGIIECKEIQCVAGRGIKGDRFFDFKPDYKGQITFFAEEVYDDLCQLLGVHAKDPSVFRRNVVTSGCDLNELIGKHFEVQGVLFFGTEESRPCYWMEQAFATGAEAALRGRGGLRAKVMADGTLRVDR